MKRSVNDADDEPKKKRKLAELEDLLDISNIGNDELEARFQLIANVIFCDYELVVGSLTGESRYTVLELEFYLWIPGSHEDPYTHGSEEQQIPAQWYFHRSPRPSKDSHRNLTSLTSYRGGSRKGLDITIASSSSQKNIKGGILLRTLSRTSPDPKIICGPSLIVDEILHASGAASIPSLVETKWDPSTGRNAFRPGGSLSQTTHLTFLPREVEQPGGSHPTVYRSPRIGLDLSHPGTTPTRDHPRLQYLPKPYRFFIHPDQLDKGRPQTFLGVLHSYLPSPSSGSGPLRANPAVRAKVMTIMGIKRGTFDRYFDDYATGVDKGAIRTYVGAAGKGAASSPATYLRMLGTLERFFASSE